MQLNQNHCPVIDISQLIRDIDIFAASSYHHILFSTNTERICEPQKVVIQCATA